MAKIALRGEAYSTAWEYTQISRTEGRRPDSTLNGMNSLEDLMALNHGLGRFRKDVHGLSRAVHDQDPYDPGRFIGF
ncbi:hypothetical protein F2Q70_00002948 [Brassica cretica]|uniref:Uncharacterized protein n=1 Tax=Brassica cretica TaxID=69181 RepID=A0A8S9J276_BRACR|nr:hypothetical protein F2Q70_00002948 [Brassica cretica]